MKLIVAVDQNWGIGKNGKLLVSIPADMKFFRETTTGNVVIMGRHTLESFPNGLPLKNRINIVITNNQNYDGKGAIVVHSVEEAMEAAKQYADKEIYVIGGAAIYKEFLEYCDTAYVTYIDYTYEADCYFPKLTEAEGWKLTEESEEQTYFDIEYYFRTYKKER